MKATHLAALVILGVIALSCGTTTKLSGIRKNKLMASINLREKENDFSQKAFDGTKVNRDTIHVNIDGHDMMLMRAVRDDETGQMVATEQLNAAMVTARFRNVAERHGKVDLQFEVLVPKEMFDQEWQLRLYPDLFVLDDSVRLDNVVLTGDKYRQQQLKGYQQYRRFLSKIVDDPDHFVDMRNLEIFLERNFPHVYAFRADSSIVSDDQFERAFGISEGQVIDHYTRRMALYINERKKSMKSFMFARYVKAPIETEHIRLDTVIRNLDGDFRYFYTQTVSVKRGMKKADIKLSGGIFEQDKQLYTIPANEPLTFYISSLSSFVDNSERYLTKVIERRAEYNASWNIDFKLGSSDMDETIGDNAGSMQSVRNCLRDLLTDEVYDLDSITVAAFASPEGRESLNIALSSRRATSAADYFGRYAEHIRDSLNKGAGFVIDVSSGYEEKVGSGSISRNDIRFRTSASGENWSLLDQLVARDSCMCPEDQVSYERISKILDHDSREDALRTENYYLHLKDDLYPLLRTVQFNFYLHRKGMVKDTVHTTVLDSTYMKGVQAIRDRDYETAVALLMPYDDFNTAIAYTSLDRNISALSILEKLEKTAQVNYMLAILSARTGNIGDAVNYYLKSCSQDNSYVHRGNLDPEIAELKRTYIINEHYYE